MGHVGRLKAEYRELAERLQAGPVAYPEPDDPVARRGWQEILEILYTPEEAALAARLPVRPMSLEKLAARVGLPAEALRPRLEAMADKGLVMDLVHAGSGRTAWFLSPPVVGFFEYSLMRAADSVPKKRMAEALHAYTHGDEAFAREAFGGETTIGRALVHEPALDEEALPEVLDWQRASAVIGDARAWAVSLCFCRHKAEHLGQACDAPVDNCLSVNGGAEFVIRRGFGRAIGKGEALELLARSREAAACSGCSRCARACPVAAIEMVPERQAGKPKNGLAPAIDGERCIGCGVCATACHQGALKMEEGGAPRHVPATAVERMVRMAIERGRLADLLFDEGAGAGSRFLHHAVRALTTLPLASRAMASAQVKSRFVKAALAGFKG